MKKQKWIKIIKKGGQIIEIDYGWQATNFAGNLVLTRICDGKQIEINLKDIDQIIHNTK